jgi:hypothetical protein
MYTHYCGKKIADMKSKEIIDLVERLYESIYVVECYGAKDIPLLETFMNVLHKRGYEINEDTKLSIKKSK